MRGGLGGLLIAAAWLAGGETRAQSQPEAQEYQLKAAFLYNFAKFIEWPPNTLGEEGSPIVVCVVGKDPFGAVLDQAILYQTVQGRPMTVRRGEKLSELRRCHILFISSSEKKRLPEIFQALARANVLTVGEAERFVQLGGIINFVVEENKVRFEINVDNADRAGLKISSQLLRLARVVRTAHARGGG